MALLNVYDRIYSGGEQVLSDTVAVSLLSWLFSPMRNSSQCYSSSSVFHFSRIQQGDNLSIAMARHQHLLFSQLHLRPGKRVLALACGNGAIAQQLVQFSGVSVVGVDTDAQLISRAKVTAETTGLSDRLTYHHVDDICKALEHFPACSFDAVYAIELGYRTTSLTTLHKQIERLLKPSGKFATYEWCFTDEMNLANTEHVEAAQSFLQSLPNMAHIDSIRSITDLVSTFRSVGLVNVAATDLTLRDKVIPWYRPLEDHQSSASNSPLALSWWHDQLSIAAMLTAARLRIFSPMVLVTGEKSSK